MPSTARDTLGRPAPRSRGGRAGARPARAPAPARVRPRPARSTRASGPRARGPVPARSARLDAAGRRAYPRPARGPSPASCRSTVSASRPATCRVWRGAGRAGRGRLSARRRFPSGARSPPPGLAVAPPPPARRPRRAGRGRRLSARRSSCDALERGAGRRRGRGRRDGPEGGSTATGRSEALASGVRAAGRSRAGAGPRGPRFSGSVRGLPEAGGPASAVGSAAVWLARGAARRGETPSFVECGPGSPLDEGGALRRLARAVRGPASGLGPGARGGRPTARRDDGPPVSVLAIAVERWDGRSRRALAESLPAIGFRLFATRALVALGGARPPLLPPGRRRRRLAPLASVRLRARRRGVARSGGRGAASDAARFLEIAWALAARFDPGRRTMPERRRPGRHAGTRSRGRRASRGRVPRAKRRRPPVRRSDRGGASLRRAAGGSSSSSEGRYAYRDDGERRRIAARVPAPRGATPWRGWRRRASAPRLVAAALARGDPADVAAALDLLEAGARRRGRTLARAARRSRSRRPPRAPHAASRRGRGPGASPRRARPGARALPGGNARRRRGARRVLVDSADDEARLVLARVEKPRGGTRRTASRVRLLAAELHERAHDYGDAAAALAEAGGCSAGRRAGARA